MEGEKDTLAHYSPLIQRLLRERGIQSQEEADVFLTPDYEAHQHDPFLMPDMEKAVERILVAMAKKERIAIYTDFDCDGIPGAVVLSDLFARLAYEYVEVRIPHRHFEGYGFHTDAIDELAHNGASLIITVDVGTVAFEGIDHAQKKGIDVIVTDHHELGTELPKAYAVLNPKRAPYPFPHLCGAGVAFKLTQALLREGKKRDLEAFRDVPVGWEKWLLDMVSIATIADMVPLVGENRVLALYGLKVLRKSPRPGIVALMRALRAKQSEITEDDIGFLIGPRINAASRMDEPELAFRLLSTRSVQEAEILAGKLEALNRKRKGAVAAMVRDAKKKLKERTTESRATVLGDPEWRPALLGLAANSILEETGGIVCMWGRDGAGVLKGSCRSDGSASVVELFQAARDSLLEYGGHHASGGFSVSHEHIHTLAAVFEKQAGKLSRLEKAALAGTHEVPLSDASWDVYREVEHFAPFGTGNPKPVFVFRGVIVREMRRFGKAQEHLELTVCTENGCYAKAIRFFAEREAFTVEPAEDMSITLSATLERSTFGNVPELRLRIVDIALA